MKVLILAGGFGSRLWPLSTKREPKQFLPLFAHKSLLQNTIARAKAIAEPHDIFIATQIDHKPEVVEHAIDESIPLDNVLTEPCCKNTCPAIALAFRIFLENDPDSEQVPFLICPSDHWIEENLMKFIALMQEAEALAKQNQIITFGVAPAYPETGYGYIQVESQGKSCSIVEFKEKPDLAAARRYVEAGSYFWNSGMFVMSPKTFFEALKESSSKLFAFFDRPSEAILSEFSTIEPTSFDVAVMEKVANRQMLPMTLGWSDIGSWESIYRCFPKDDDKNVVHGEGLAKESQRCLVLSETTPVVALGVSDLVIVQTEDAILVAPRGLPDETLRSAGEGIEGKTEFRPWGSFTILSRGRHSLTKRIRIFPNKRLSLQKHQHRDEHWVIVQGTAEVTLGETTGIYYANQSLFIPKGMVHRVHNPNQTPLEIIEVQTGDSLTEEDIIRYEDDFGRVPS